MSFVDSIPAKRLREPARIAMIPRSGQQVRRYRGKSVKLWDQDPEGALLRFPILAGQIARYVEAGEHWQKNEFHCEA